MSNKKNVRESIDGPSEIKIDDGKGDPEPA